MTNLKRRAFLIQLCEEAGSRDAVSRGSVANEAKYFLSGAVRKTVLAGSRSDATSRIYENKGQNVSPGGQPMSVESLQELFLDELKDLYSAEKQITKALPKMVKAATAPKLKDAFQSHLEETNGQIERLETIFEMLKKKGTGKTCEGMKGVLSEGAEVLEETKKGDLRDSGLITAAQRVEHYEMAGYGGVREYARLLGQREIMALLDATLKEEEAADKKLTQIAKEVNAAALNGSKAENN
jgi:ferritin-like metal-binding protein YciE